jgi:hypothetical protein
MKKIFLISLLLTLPYITNAKVYISEIMYDVEGTDTGREWIEIYNDTAEGVDLSTYFLFETNVSHKITKHLGENLLAPNSFAIIADNVEKFLIDYPSYSGSLFDSVFSLNNAGEELILQDAIKAEVDKAVYSSDLGAVDNGNSLQFYQNIFIPGNPTPGNINITEPEDESDDTDTDNATSSSNSSTSNSAHSSQNSLSNYVPKPKVKTGIGRDRVVTINTPVEFEIYHSTEEKGKYFWNFGDGGSSKKNKATHIYEYAGEFNVVLQAYFDDYKNTSRAKIKVIEPSLEVSIEDFTIFIKNTGNSEVNIGQYFLKINGKNLKILEDTIVSKGQSFQVKIDENPINVYFYYPNGIKYYSNSEDKAQQLCQKVESSGLICEISKIAEIFDKM